MGWKTSCTFCTFCGSNVLAVWESAYICERFCTFCGPNDGANFNHETQQRSGLVKGRTEKQIHAGIVRLLSSLGALYTHPANEGARDPREAAILRAMGVRAGTPDIIVMHAAGRWQTVLLEVKSADGKVSKAQAEFALDVQRRGGQVHVVRNEADALAVMLAAFPELQDPARR